MKPFSVSAARLLSVSSLVFCIALVSGSATALADFTVTVYEQSGSINAYTFSQDDIRLYDDTSGMPGPPSQGYIGYDFGTIGCEYYDIFFCDSAGTVLDIGPGDPLPQDLFLKLECWDISCNTWEPVGAPTWNGAGNNIDAVVLDIDGEVLYGQAVVEEVYGLCDEPFEEKISDFASSALGPPDAEITKMGGGYTVITLRMRSATVSPCAVAVNYPHSGTVFRTGGQHSIDVTQGDCAGGVSLELYKGDVPLCHIADIGGRWYEWYDVTDCGGGPGWDYRIKATCLTDPGCFGFSDYFTMLDGSSGCEIVVNYPHSGTTLYTGGQHSIEITQDGCGDMVSLDLLKGDSFLCRISEAAGASYDWFPVSDCGGGPGTDYRILATCLSDPGCFALGEYFTIAEGAGGCELVVSYPDSAATFYIGGQHMIEVLPNSCGDEVRLELYRGDSPLCPIADIARSWYEWNGVSDCGGGPGADYRIRATCLSDPGCFDFSDYFTMAVPDTSVHDMEHDPLTAAGNVWFDWIENGIGWVPAEYGFIYGDVPFWYDALISGRAFDPADDPVLIYRVFNSPGTSNFICGFTSSLPPANDFHYANVGIGLYLHSTGTIRPAWDVNDAGYWSTALPAGFYDIMIALDGSAGTVELSIERVADWSSPRADFSSPVWSSVEHRPIGGPYHIQINPYNEGSRVYDVWASGDGSTPPPPPPPPEGMEPLILSVEDVGNDAGRQVRLKWQASGLDAPGSGRPVTGYAMWRRIDELPAGIVPPAAADPGPVPLYPPGDWDYLGTVPACCEETYATILPTLADSTAENGIHWSVFFVRALTETPETYFDSPPDSGYSVCDYLPPDPPEEPDLSEPSDYLGRCYPNPFNPSTEISFGLKERGRVLIRIFDATGRLVRTLVDREMPAGDHAESWNGIDDAGRMAASGIYFCRFESGQMTRSIKMVLLR